MTGSTSTSRPAAATGRSGAPVVAWSVTALVVGAVGLLLYALSERSGDRLLGIVLTGAGVLAALTGAAVLATGRVARPWSLALSSGLVVLGVVAAGVALTGTASNASDALVLGLPPVVGGLVTAALALSR